MPNMASGILAIPLGERRRGVGFSFPTTSDIIPNYLLSKRSHARLCVIIAINTSVDGPQIESLQLGWKILIRTLTLLTKGDAGALRTRPMLGR